MISKKIRHWTYCLFHYILPTCCLALCALSIWPASHKTQDFLKQLQGNPKQGKAIYKHFCANCHAENPLIVLAAPRKGSTSDWQARIEQNISLLLMHSDEGLGAMPARGGCFECSQEQLIAALNYMLPKKLKKELFNKLTDHKKVIYFK